MLKKIELHGILAQRFGKFFELDVATPREACEALSYQLKGFKRFMASSHESGLFFAVYTDDELITAGEVEANTGAKVIRIVPQVMGAGGDTMGWFQVIAGAVMVGVGFFMGPAGYGLIAAGAGMMIGGAAALLMPTPQVSPSDPEGNKASYAFGGAVTTVAQGNPVPLLYGGTEIGGSVESIMIVNEDT